MVFVEIFFAEMAFAKSKDGFVKNIFVEMDLVKSRSGLRRKYLYGNCLRQVQEWSSSKLSSPKWSSSSPEAVFAENILVEIVFVKSKNDLRRIFLRRDGLRPGTCGKDKRIFNIKWLLRKNICLHHRHFD